MYKKIINESFNSVYEKKEVLSNALLVPLILFMFFEYIQIDSVNSIYTNILSFIVTFALSVTVAITTHRILLIDENPVPKWGLYKFSSREWSFVLNSILLAIIIIVPSFLFALIPYVGIFIILIYIPLIFSRISLVFPSIAVDRDMTFSEAWDITKGHKLLMFLMVVVLPVFISAIVSFVYGIAINYLVKVVSSYFILLNSVLNIVITVFIISFLSATYKYLREITPDTFDKIPKQDDRQIEFLEKENFYKISIPNNIDISFEQIKDELTHQYSMLGFDNEVINKQDSWMLKNPDLFNAYVSLSFKDEAYKVEVFNSIKPNISVLDY